MAEETIDPKLEAAADRILKEIADEREAKYQQALHIARNDLVTREEDLLTRKEQLRELSLWLEDVGYSDPEMYEDIVNLVGKTEDEVRKTRRSRRASVSEAEGSYIYEEALLKYLQDKNLTAEKLVSSIGSAEAKQRRLSQPVPGSHAHHQSSLSSTESLVQNMREDEIRKLFKIAEDNGYVIGSRASEMMPLSRPGHLTGGKTRGTAYAHVGVTGEPDPGRFKMEPLPSGTTAEEAWPILKQNLDKQRELNDIAYENRMEQLSRQRASEAAGEELKWSGSDLSGQRGRAAQKGVNLTTIAESFEKYPELAETGLVPGVDVMTDVGATVPRSLGGKKAGREARRRMQLNMRGGRASLKLVPLVPLGMAMVESVTKGAQAAQASMQGDEAKASQLGGESALAFAEGIVGEVPVVGDILIADPAADTTLEGAARTQQQVQAKRQQQQQTKEKLQSAVKRRVSRRGTGVRNRNAR